MALNNFIPKVVSIQSYTIYWWIFQHFIKTSSHLMFLMNKFYYYTVLNVKFLDNLFYSLAERSCEQEDWKIQRVLNLSPTERMPLISFQILCFPLQWSFQRRIFINWTLRFSSPLINLLRAFYWNHLTSWGSFQRVGVIWNFKNYWKIFYGKSITGNKYCYWVLWLEIFGFICEEKKNRIKMKFQQKFT